MWNMRILDLYCGMGGWAKGLIDTGHDVIGYDIVDFSHVYPGEFVRADLLTLNNFPRADVIAASPPCTDFSKASFPPTWKSVQRFPPNIPLAIQLFRRVYDIARIVRPKYYIIENVRGAQPYVGKAKQHIGSRYFWGVYPEFNVVEANDLYGKWLLPPSPDRPAIRSMIPLSISRAFGKALQTKEY